MNALKLKLIELIKEALNNEHIDISDLDRISMIAKSSQNELPEKFISIVNSMENHFDPNAIWETHESLSRLISVYETDVMIAELGSSNTSDLDDNELMPTFELDANDKDRVALLCAQMRKIVFASELFDQPHRRRLLNRIAAIEKQIEQPKGMLDVIRGGVSDIGETLGKFGVDIKPLTDRMTEVMQITRAGSKEYEQLPAPEEVKQLPKPSDEEKAEGK